MVLIVVMFLSKFMNLKIMLTNFLNQNNYILSSYICKYNYIQYKLDANHLIRMYHN